MAPDGCDGGLITGGVPLCFLVMVLIQMGISLAILLTQLAPGYSAFYHPTPNWEYHHHASYTHKKQRFVYTDLHSTELFSSFQEGRLYKVRPNNDQFDINSHIALLHKVLPEIKPEPLVMDAVEECYLTQYETYRFFPKSKEEVTISVRKTSFGCGKLGSSIWRCGLALSCHLVSLFDTYDESELKSMRVIELGAGVGLVSSVCREMGVGKVMATDFWEQHESFGTVLDKERLVPHQLFGVNLDFNVVQGAGIASKRRDLDSISVEKLDWGSEVDAFKTKVIFDPTLIIASDVVYNATDPTALIRTLELLMGGESAITTKVEAILFLDYNGRNDEDVENFITMINVMVDSHQGWAVSKEELKFCYWIDTTCGLFQEEYSLLEIRLKN